MSGKPAIKRGRTGYAMIMRRTLDEPLTIPECMQHFGMSENGATAALQAMHALKLVYIHHWVPRPLNPSTPAYAFGDQADCPYPSTTRNGRAAKAPRRTKPARLPVELVALAALLRELQEDASTSIELADATGVSRNSLHIFIKEVMRPLGLVYIKSWEPQPTGGPPLARWAFGIDKKNAPRPTKKQLRHTTNQRYYWARKAKDEQLRLLRSIACNNSIFNQAQERQPEAA